MKRAKRIGLARDLWQTLNELGLKYHNILFLALGVAIAYYILTHSNLPAIIESVGEFGYVGSFIAGMFAAYGITAVPGYSAFFVLSGELNVVVLSILASAGAAVSNYVIFKFVKDNLMGDLKNLSRDLKIKPIRILSHMKKSKVLNRILPLIAGLIFASPLPDEIAAALLGASKYNVKKFLAYAWGFHFIGFLLIGYFGSL